MRTAQVTPQGQPPALPTRLVGACGVRSPAPATPRRATQPAGDGARTRALGQGQGQGQAGPAVQGGQILPWWSRGADQAPPQVPSAFRVSFTSQSVS